MYKIIGKAKFLGPMHNTQEPSMAIVAKIKGKTIDVVAGPRTREDYPVYQCARVPFTCDGPFYLVDNHINPPGVDCVHELEMIPD